MPNITRVFRRRIPQRKVSDSDADMDDSVNIKQEPSDGGEVKKEKKKKKKHKRDTEEADLNGSQAAVRNDWQSSGHAF